MQYFAKYTIGLEDKVTEWLSALSFAEIEFHKHWVTFMDSSDLSIEHIMSECRFLSDLYASYRIFTSNYIVESALSEIDKDIEGIGAFIKNFVPKQYETIILVSSPGHHDSEFTASVAPITQRLNRGVQGYNLSKAQIRVVQVSKDFGFIGLNLKALQNSSQSYSHLDQNSIPRHIAHSLIKLSKPSAADVFLDPFCGGGIIPIERSKYRCGYHHIYAYDIDTTIIIKKLSDSNRVEDFKIAKGDFLKSRDLRKKEITKVVTDPPWGLIDRNTNIAEMYPRFFEKLAIVMKPDGLVVLLVSDSELIYRILLKRKDKFRLLKKYDIIISGHDAFVFVITKL